MSIYTHYISIDFGTSGCAIAVGFANPDPSNVKVFSAWNRGQIGVRFKYPTVLLTDPNGGFAQFGEEALKAHKKLREIANDYFLFSRFKMNLYKTPVSDGFMSDSVEYLHVAAGPGSTPLYRGLGLFSVQTIAYMFLTLCIHKLLGFSQSARHLHNISTSQLM